MFIASDRSSVGLPGHLPDWRSRMRVFSICWPCSPAQRWCLRASQVCFTSLLISPLQICSAAVQGRVEKPSLCSCCIRCEIPSGDIFPNSTLGHFDGLERDSLAAAWNTTATHKHFALMQPSQSASMSPQSTSWKCS